ncbi:MAG: hypothetical protein ACRD4O_00425 [Bryobacteraceae bacterium]
MLPDVIVLQSPSIDDCFYDLMRASGEYVSDGLTREENEYAGIMRWPSGRESIVVTTWVPASFWHHGTWAGFITGHIGPRLATIHHWFERKLDKSPLAENGWLSKDGCSFVHATSPVQIELFQPNSAHFTVLTPTQREEWPIHRLGLAADIFASYIREDRRN